MSGKVIFKVALLAFFFGGACLIHSASLQLVLTHRNDQNPEAKKKENGKITLPLFFGVIS